MFIFPQTNFGFSSPAAAAAAASAANFDIKIKSGTMGQLKILNH